MEPFCSSTSASPRPSARSSASIPRPGPPARRRPAGRAGEPRGARSGETECRTPCRGRSPSTGPARRASTTSAATSITLDFARVALRAAHADARRREINPAPVPGRPPRSPSFATTTSGSSSSRAARRRRLTTDGGPDGLERRPRPTSTGKRSSITTTSAYWWSDDSQAIAFLRSDESGVDLVDVHGASTRPFPTVITQRYPRRRPAEPAVRLGIATSGPDRRPGWTPRRPATSTSSA